MKRSIPRITASAVTGNVPTAESVAARERKQQKRIQQGVVSGELTAKEAQKLEKREAKLHREIQKDRLDGGGLTVNERRKIEDFQWMK